jgi:hypothetical protein
VQDSKHSGTNPTANGERDLLVNQVQMVKKQWATPSAQNHDESWYQRSGNRIYPGVAMQVRMEEQKQWATPRSAMASMHPEYGEHWNDKRGGESIATQVWKEQQWGTPAANDANKTPHCEVNSNQAGLAKSVGLELQRQWGTPTARDHKSGRGNEEREYKELTPMVERTQSGKLNPRWVETLMGLPVGWVMPSCAYPVTIEQTNSDSWETESCQPQQPELL